MGSYAYLFGLILTLHLNAAPAEPTCSTHAEVRKCDYWGDYARTDART